MLCERSERADSKLDNRFGVRGRKVKSHDCALASDLVKAAKCNNYNMQMQNGIGSLDHVRFGPLTLKFKFKAPKKFEKLNSLDNFCAHVMAPFFQRAPPSAVRATQPRRQRA